MIARTRVLVLTKFQRWFLINFVAYTALFLILFAAGLFFWSRMLVNEVLNLAGLLSHTFLTVIQKHLWMGLGVTVLFLVVLLGVAALQALYFSRAIAGPIFALARHLEKCESEGKLQPLKLRKDDLFEDVVEKFNRMSSKINQSGSSFGSGE